MSLTEQCYKRWSKLPAGSSYILQWSRRLIGRSLSYFNEGDLELPVDELGHLNEEGRLVGVMFDDVVVHVDENPGKETILNLYEDIKLGQSSPSLPNI